MADARATRRARRLPCSRPRRLHHGADHEHRRRLGNALVKWGRFPTCRTTVRVTTMFNRRTFLGTTAAGLFAASNGIAQQTPRKRLAVVTTVWNYRSHAWHMAE